MTAPRAGWRSTKALGRVAAGAAFSAVLVAGALVTHEFWGPVEDNLGLGPVVLSVYWGLAALLLVGLVVPTWRGSTQVRRLLGVASLAGFAAALHWLSYEPGDLPGFAVGTTVAVLLGTATAAAALAERLLRSRPHLGVASVVVLALALVAVLWRADSASETVAVDARLSVLADGRTVRSDFATDSCGEPLRLEVVETPQEVRVLTLITIGRGFPRGCDGVPVARSLEATLEAPLGQRALRPA